MDDRNASKDIIYQAYITYSVMHYKTFCDGQSEMITGSCGEVLNILFPATQGVSWCFGITLNTRS